MESPVGFLRTRWSRSPDYAFKPLNGFSKGNTIRSSKTHKYKFSRVIYEPFKSRAYEFEQKLELLVDELLKDVNSVNLISKSADFVYIGACRNHYIDGNMGLHLSAELIQKIQRLNLDIDIDTYVGGTPLKD